MKIYHITDGLYLSIDFFTLRDVLSWLDDNIQEDVEYTIKLTIL